MKWRGTRKWSKRLRRPVDSPTAEGIFSLDYPWSLWSGYKLAILNISTSTPELTYLGPFLLWDPTSIQALSSVWSATFCSMSAAVEALFFPALTLVLTFSVKKKKKIRKDIYSIAIFYCNFTKNSFQFWIWTCQPNNTAIQWAICLETLKPLVTRAVQTWASHLYWQFKNSHYTHCVLLPFLANKRHHPVSILFRKEILSILIQWHLVSLYITG